MHNNTTQYNKGIAIILVLVFAGVFVMSMSALMGFILTQAQLGTEKVVREQAFGIAEAGLEYYHWFLIQHPNDLQDGTGTSGPYVHQYTDPSGGSVGNFSLSIVGNKSCGVVQSVDITSTGTSDIDPKFKRTLFGRHAAKSVAEYSYIIGADVWAGSDRNITGPYHSNGGIRMDGTNNSTVSSAVSSWLCDYSFGCSPSQTQNGVFGSGTGSALWKYPTNSISFADMATNFSNMKSYAQSSGIYLAPYGNTTINYAGYNTAADGYHLIFNSDGTVDIYKVTSTSGYWGWLSDTGWTPDFHIIYSESFVERKTIPASCSLIFVEDKVWIEGTVKGKVTVVAADLTNNGYNPDVIINGDINYSTLDGSDGLTVISENGIFIPPQSQNNLSIRGIFVAQGDRFGRSYYSYDTKNQLTIHGSIISKKRVGTSWACGNGFCSGYANRISSYDRLQTTNPPPFTPASTTTAQYVLWREQ